MPLEPISFNSLAPQHDAAIAEALLSVLKDNRFILGDRLATFEMQFANFTRVRHCVGTANGHDALVLAMRSVGLGEGAEEVLVPSNTYIATWLAVNNAGCIPVPVEPDPATHNIDPKRIEERITPRTKAIIPVHLYGNPCDMETILAIARKYNLKVVEDNAQAHGATFEMAGSAASHPAQLTGSFGDANATSFYPTKNLGALGDGGAVTTNDDALAARLARLRNYGFSSPGVCDEWGINSRLDELQAAVLSVKLKRLNLWNNERRSIARIYDEKLSGVGDLLLPVPTPGGTHVYHLYIVRTGRREKLREHLGKEGIQTMVHYPIPPHLQKAYAGLGYRRGSLPVSEQLADEVVSLPIWPGMSEAQVERVCMAVRRFY